MTNKNNNKTMEALASNIWTLAGSIRRTEAAAAKLEQRKKAFKEFHKDAKVFLMELPDTDPATINTAVVGGLTVPFNQDGVRQILQKLQELYDAVVESVDAQEFLLDMHGDFAELVSEAIVWPYGLDNLFDDEISEISDAEESEIAETDAEDDGGITPEQASEIYNLFAAKHDAVMNNADEVEHCCDNDAVEDDIGDIFGDLGLVALDAKTGDITEGDHITISGGINLTINIGGDVNIDD